LNTGFAYFARRDPAVTAVVDPGGREWSRGEVLGLVNRTARAFRSAGLNPGDALAVAAPNCAEHLVVLLAGIEAGLYLVPINWHLAPNEVAFLLKDSGAKAIVTHASLGEPRLRMLLENRAQATVLVAIGGADSFLSFASFVSAESSEPFPPGPLGRTMPYTSATTGTPKGVVLPLQDALAARDKFIRWNMSLGIDLDAGNTHLCASMLYQSACLEGVINALHMGHRVVLLERWDPETTLRLIELYRVTFTYVVPTMFVRLLKLPDAVRARYDVSSLKCVVHGGAACPLDTKRRIIEWWGPIVWEAYGSAEGAGTIASPEDCHRYPGTVGKPVQGSRIKIIDEQGEELPPGEVGMIYLTRYTGDRFEYKGDAAKTAASYRGDFFTVGDVGYVNEQGYLFICDRRADIIISGGYNIYPAEIELVLVEHPSVADCAVLGERHQLFGEVPIALVQLQPGVRDSPTLTLNLLRYLGGKLAAAKVPKGIRYVANIPRDPSGKLHKRVLYDKYPRAPQGAATT
jgi:long-chain acyl-CoA synthetase